MTEQPGLFDAQPDPPSRPPDQAARDFAVDPANDVVLEASAGTGKTRVLVDRYVRLIEAGVAPRHILAVTFTRKAAAEMRERVMAELWQRAALRLIDADRWRHVRERIADIQISTIDAFCFGLLREFPLEADVDPAFQIADETEMARFASEALDLTLQAARGRLADDETIRLLFTRVKTPVLRQTVAGLLDRRHVALPALAAFVQRTSQGQSAAAVAAEFVRRLDDRIGTMAERTAILDDGPHGAPEFGWLLSDLRALPAFPADDPAAVQRLRRRLERYFLTSAGTARMKVTRPYRPDQFASADAKRRHEAALRAVSPVVLAEFERLDTRVNALLARGLLTIMAIAAERYERLLEDHALLDFAGMLAKAVALLARQEEFARSRLKLQARYHHLLVDEFQDTSRLQWQLIDLLIDAWGEGEGAADAPTSIFVVGDRKQSIYRFRHADVRLLDEAARRIGALRGGRSVTRAITASFRAVPELLAFVNALSASMAHAALADDRFRFSAEDRFAVSPPARGRRDGQPVVGLAVGETMGECAAAVASEVERLLETGTVRDRERGPRAVRPDDIAILFRARAGHQYYEDALEARGIRTYVYKGLGFFDAPEVQDLQALLRYLAKRDSDLRAAEILRSRLFRVSDVGLRALAPAFADVLRAPDFDLDRVALSDLDRALVGRARADLARWSVHADHVPPGDLLDRVLVESAYFAELAGRRLDQARENVKKVRALVRKVENRGYATISRLADYFETLRAGEESNAVVAAAGAVNLMTIHAAKGLEFPVVFVVNLHVGGRGRGSGITVSERGPDGLSDVTFGSSEATRLEDARDTEELKRLLYVAVTRARDRLYLSAVLDQYRLKRTARAFSGLLPESLADAFADAASGSDVVQWSSPEGPFDLAVCEVRPPVAAIAEPVAPDDVVQVNAVTVSGVEANSVSAFVAGAGPGRPAAAARAGRTGDRLIGTLVHRLFQRDPDPALPADALATIVAGLVGDAERVDVDRFDEVVENAVAAWRRVCEDAELAALFATGRRDYEVPFSFRAPGAGGEILRGVIDCLVSHPDGRLTVVEVKTGDPRPEHDLQARLYAEAVSAAFDDSPVAIKIVYSGPCG